MGESAVLSGEALYREFQSHMDELKADGLVDFKMKVFNSRDTSVDGVVLTLTNALKLRKEGKAKPVDII